MATATSNKPIEELDRQIKQSEMIRQYLQVTNADENSLFMPRSSSLSDSYSSSTINNRDDHYFKILPSTYNFHELRKDLKMAEERVERLRHELKEIQAKRDISFYRTPPPYISVSTNSNHSEFDHRRISSSIDRIKNDRATPPLVHELLSSQQRRQSMVNDRITSPLLRPPHLAVPVDWPKDRRQRQFLFTMRQHREQLTVYLNSLKQALASLDTLATLEPSRSEVQLANMKLETIHQKSRQLRALKSIRSSQQAPFIECRIRQFERDLVYMLSEHQKDVQDKLELNEQRSSMLVKIMQVTDELASVDQQIQQLLSSPDTNTLEQLSNRNPIRHVSFREPVTKSMNIYYHH